MLRCNENSKTPERNLLVFSGLAKANPTMFARIWARCSAMERAELRESIRLLWISSRNNRQTYGYFLLVTSHDHANQKNRS